MKALHHFSLATAPTQIYNAQGVCLSEATSFFYETVESKLFLITNWHVVTGRNPTTPSSSKTGAVPTVLKLKVHRKQKKVNGKTVIVTSDIGELSVPINSENGNNPLWIEHPKHKFKVDVVALRIENQSEFREKYELNVVNKWPDYHEDYDPDVMDDVHVIGYPWGLSATAGRGGGLPVYKRGCIASDPIVDFRRLPCLLIDCRTTRAMSGSPVIASHRGIFMPDGKMSGDTVIGTVSKLLGVYAGRLYSDEAIIGSEENISEIGVVWKASVLEDITKAESAGTPLRDFVG